MYKATNYNYIISSCDSGPSEIILDDVLSLTSSSDTSLAQGHGESTNSSTEQIEQPQQPSMSISEVVTASQPCNAPCCQDSLEVFQVTDKNILRKTRKVQGHGRQFCSEWYQKYPWLILCVTYFTAFCSTCRYCYKQNLLTDKLGEATFVTEGFNNWKKAIERFERHARSGLHKEAILKVQYLKQPGIDVHLNNQHLATLKVRRDNMLILLSSLKYLLRQGLAIRGHEEMNGNLMQLLLLQAKGNCALQSFITDKHYLSNDIINEIIKLMGRTVLQQLLVEIRKAGWFSLIADETTDVSHKEQLCIAIRWVDNLFQINKMPLELINVPKTDADTITHLIKDFLIRMSLPIGKCRGQAYDGATSMSGHINGVAAQIQRVEPSAIFVRCLVHCTNLCLQEVGK